MNVNAVNHVKFLKIDVMGSVNFVKIGFVLEFETSGRACQRLLNTDGTTKVNREQQV